ALLTRGGLDEIGDVRRLALGPPILDLVVVDAPDVGRRAGLDGGVEAVGAALVARQLLEGDVEVLLLRHVLEVVADERRRLREVVGALPDDDLAAGGGGGRRGGLGGGGGGGGGRGGGGRGGGGGGGLPPAGRGGGRPGSTAGAAGERRDRRRPGERAEDVSPRE